MRKKEREICEFQMYLKIFFGSLFGKKKRGKGRERGKRALFAFPSPQFPARPKACSRAIFFLLCSNLSNTNESHNQADCVSPCSLVYPSQGTRAHWMDRPDKTSVEHNET